MATKSIRLDTNLIFQAESAAALQCRSIPSQVEYWANIGRMISNIIGIEDALAIYQGLKKIRIEPTQTIPVNSDTVFNNLEADRVKCFANKPITSAPFFFEASKKIPGLLDKVDSVTGERKTGKFENGKFREVNA